MSGPRVLVIAHEHPELITGGSGMVARDLTRALNSTGSCQALLVATTSAFHRPPRLHTPFQAIAGSAGEMLMHVAKFDRFLFSNGAAGATRPHTERLLRTFAPDIVHLHHLDLVGVELVAMIRHVCPNVRIIMTMHDFSAICTNDGLMTTRAQGELCHRASADGCHACFPEIPAVRFALRATHLRNQLSLIDRFIAPSQFIRKRYIDWGIAAERIDVIGNTVPEELAPFVTEEQRATRQRFGFFGNLAPHKGILIALDAVRRIAPNLPELRFRVHGTAQFQDDAFQSRLEQAAVAASPAASLHGRYRREDLPELLSNIDWVVVPSTWWENAPLVILEAFRHHRPVIAANAGGMAEFVSDGSSGMLFRLGDADDLARVMTRAASENGLWQRLRESLPRVDNTAHAAAEHLTLYHELLSEQPREIA